MSDGVVGWGVARPLGYTLRGHKNCKIKFMLPYGEPSKPCSLFHVE